MMSWEAAAISFLSDALKRLIGRLGISYEGRRAGQLISEATQELLKENPRIEKARALLLEAEARLETPSVELLNAQLILDRVLGAEESAHNALRKMHSEYLRQGNVKGVADLLLLTGRTHLQFEKYDSAAEAFQKAREMFERLGDHDRILEIFVYVIAIDLHEARQERLRQDISEVIEFSRRPGDPRFEAAVLARLGLSLAQNYNLIDMPVRLLLASWSVQESEETWELAREISKIRDLPEADLEVLAKKTASIRREEDNLKLAEYLSSPLPD